MSEKEIEANLPNLSIEKKYDLISQEKISISFWEKFKPYFQHNQNAFLNIAIEHGDLDVFYYLVEVGANIHAYDEHALRWAAYKGHQSIVEFLVGKGAKNELALINASEKGHLDIVKFLVKSGFDVNAKACYGKTSLIQAAAYGRLEVVKFLVKFGADIEAKNVWQETALYLATKHVYGKVAKFLVDSIDRDINMENILKNVWGCGKETERFARASGFGFVKFFEK